MSEQLGPPDKPRKLNAASMDFEAAYNAAQEPPVPAQPTRITPNRPSDAAAAFIREYDQVIADSTPAPAEGAATPEPAVAPAAPDSAPEPDQPQTHLRLVASAKGDPDKLATAGAESRAMAEYEASIEQQAEHWEQVAGASHWASMVAKPSGGNPNLEPGWEYGWKGFSHQDTPGTDLELFPKAMEGAAKGLRGGAPVDYLIAMPADTMDTHDKYTYYTFVTRSDHPLDNPDDEPLIAIQFRLPREGVAADDTSQAFNQSLKTSPELADRVARRLFATEFASGVVQRATARRLCLIMGKQFVNMGVDPATAYAPAEPSPDGVRHDAMANLAKTIAWFEASLANYQTNGPSTWHAKGDGKVVQGPVPDGESGVPIVDLPYQSVKFPLHGDQPIDEALKAHMQREMPSHWRRGS